MTSSSTLGVRRTIMKAPRCPAPRQLLQLATFSRLAQLCDRSALELAAVTPATCKDYLRRVKEVSRFVKMHPELSPDIALCRFFEEMFKEGFAATHGQLLPGLGSTTCVRQGKKGSQGLESLEASPFQATYSDAGRHGYHWGHGLLGSSSRSWGVLLGFLAYLRPSELLGLRRRHFVKGHSMPSSWAILLGDMADKPTKTGEYNQSVLLDSLGFEWMRMGWPLLPASASDKFSRSGVAYVSGAAFTPHAKGGCFGRSAGSGPYFHFTSFAMAVPLSTWSKGGALYWRSSCVGAGPRTKQSDDT
eukprot:2028582-Amphidinium_carterae.4